MRIIIEGEDLRRQNILSQDLHIDMPTFGITGLATNMHTWADHLPKWWDCSYEIEKTDTFVAHLMWGDVTLRSISPLKSNILHCFFEEQNITLVKGHRDGLIRSVLHYTSADLKPVPVRVIR
jgi:hypothetical protein